jgi:hypothetical protein
MEREREEGRKVVGEEGAGRGGGEREGERERARERERYWLGMSERHTLN